MKILLVHNRYRQRGGEDVVVEAEQRMLVALGHDVVLHEVSNDDLDESRRLKLARQTIWNGSEKRVLADKLEFIKPDVVHVHNTFPRLSPSIYSACSSADVPVVQTLHNYRLACVNGLLLRDGKTCDLCVGKMFPLSGIRYSCYHNSKAQSAVVASMLSTHNIMRTWTRRIQQFITLTEFVKATYVRQGIPESMISVKPSFVEQPPSTVSAPEVDAPALFVGRLAEEKGVKNIIEAWRDHSDMPRLRIVGDGPLRESVEALARENNNIEYVGKLDARPVADEMLQSRFLVMPSTFYEGFGMTAVESFSAGRAVIASSHGAIGEVVDDGSNGWHIVAGSTNSLVQTVRQAASDHGECVRRGQAARATFDEKYTIERNGKLLMSIYEEVVGRQ